LDKSLPHLNLNIRRCEGGVVFGASGGCAWWLGMMARWWPVMADGG